MRRLVIALVLAFATAASADFEVGYGFTPGAKTGTPAPARIRIVAAKTTTFGEAIAELQSLRASVDPIISLMNLKQGELGYRPIAAFGYFVEPTDR